MESKKIEKKMNSETKSGTVVTRGWWVVYGEMLARVQSCNKFREIMNRHGDYS